MRPSITTRLRTSRGFTLLEMLVATVLAGVVLLGLFNFVTNMVSSEVNGMRTNTVTAWSLAGANAMNADIAGSSMVSYPAAGAGADSLVVCTNWSTLWKPSGGVLSTIDTGGGGRNVPKALFYCWDTTPTDGVFQNAILRKEVDAGGCSAAPLACTSGNYGSNSIVVTGVYKDAAGDPIFYTESNSRGVRVRYAVGNPAANAASAGSNGGTVTGTPVSVPYNAEIILED